MVPAVNSRIEGKSSSRLPKISDKAAMKGWKAAEVSRYDVPVHIVSLVVP
jgi:hypothetical protein